MKILIERAQGFTDVNGIGYQFAAGTATMSEDGQWYVIDGLVEVRASDVITRIALPDDFDLSVFPDDVVMMG